MASDHTETIRALLADGGVDNVVAGDSWPSADAAVLVLPAPGLEPRPYLDGGNTSDRQDGVQVLVRGSSIAYGAAYGVARSCYDLIHCARPTGYTSITARNAPQYIGRDDENRPRFSIQFIARIDE